MLHVSFLLYSNPEIRTFNVIELLLDCSHNYEAKSLYFPILRGYIILSDGYALTDVIVNIFRFLKLLVVMAKNLFLRTSY